MKKEIEFDLVVTRGGDDGKTSLYSGEREFKSNSVFNVLGDVDELSSFIGLLKLRYKYKYLTKIQEQLIQISSLIATNPESEFYPKYNVEKMLLDLEKEAKENTVGVKIPTYFITFGDEGEVSAYCDVIRAIARRAERNLVELIRTTGRRDLIESQNYLNRLSDFFYILGRKNSKS